MAISASMISIRPLADEDLLPVLRFFNDIVENVDALRAEAPLSLSEFRAKIKAQTAAFVAEAGGRVVGAYWFGPWSYGRAAHLANATYVVRRSEQGQGVGRQLGQHSLVEVRRHGFRAMQFDRVVVENQASVRLWQELGFSTIGTIPEGYRRHDGTFSDVYIMYRDVRNDA
jgi:L-amino acid N-acyltransferase YncA